MSYMFSRSNSVGHTVYNCEGFLKHIWTMKYQIIFILFISVLDYDTLYKIL
jgi:hypothetical protein